MDRVNFPKQDQIYANRALTHGFPELERLSPKKKNTLSRDVEQERFGFSKLSTYLERLIGSYGGKRILVLGCGPLPYVAKAFAEAGCAVTAVDPVADFVRSAAEYLAKDANVMEGVAERIPLPDASQDIVLFPAVLEHVDSVPASLNDIFRVLAPGGLLYLTTTNRFRFSFSGNNGEYRVPFYNWFPRIVKEGYIHSHLHYRPELANFSARPAVHWFSFAELCALGRDAGFSRFYSHVDLMRPEDSWINESALRRKLLRSVQRNAWLRALALLQVGGTIFMHKRAG
jgi:SAM-dependent methyltransferase